MIPTSLDKTLVDRVIELLRAQEGFNIFKKFYYGDPFEIPLTEMPCVAVELLRTKVDAGPTGMDNIEQELQIKLIYNRRNDYTTTATTEVTGVRSLEAIAQGIDPSSLEYESHTVLGILRKNFTIENSSTNQTVNIEYGIVPRPGGPTMECHITFVVEGMRTVTSRT